MNAHLKRVLSILAVGMVSASSLALVAIRSGGTWPSSWPKQLDSLRDRATTIEVAHGNQETWYEIRFSTSEEFERTWPYILSLKSKGAPITLKSGPTTNFANHVFTSGVRVLWPAGGEVSFADGSRLSAEAPWPDSAKTPSGELAQYVVQRNGTWEPSSRAGWRARVDIVLVTDGSVISTNRIVIPPGTIIMDERSPALGAAVEGGLRSPTKGSSR